MAADIATIQAAIVADMKRQAATGSVFDRPDFFTVDGEWLAVGRFDFDAIARAVAVVTENPPNETAGTPPCGTESPRKGEEAPPTNPATGCGAVGKPGNDPPGKRAVLIHPIPANAPRALAAVIAVAVRGAVRSFIDAHAASLSASDRGMMAGSIAKRAVNQLVCAEGVAAIRAALRWEE